MTPWQRLVDWCVPTTAVRLRWLTTGDRIPARAVSATGDPITAYATIDVDGNLTAHIEGTTATTRDLSVTIDLR